MKQIYEDLSDDTDFDIIDLDDVPDRDTVKRRKKKSQRDVNKTNKSEEVKRRNTLPPKILQRIHERSGLKSPETYFRKLWKRQFKSFRKKRSTPSASIITTPVKKTVQTGAKITGKLLQTGARGVTLLMIAVIAFNIFKNFWSCYPVYGSLATAVNAKNYTLGAFLGVAAFLLIMEIIFFLWALTGPCAYGDRGTKRVDTGRGLFSFLFIGITVIAAGMFWNLIPSSPSPLTGLAGGLQLYGNLKGILLPLCGIGLVSCIIRKIFS